MAALPAVLIALVVAVAAFTAWDTHLFAGVLDGIEAFVTGVVRRLRHGRSTGPGRSGAGTRNSDGWSDRKLASVSLAAGLGLALVVIAVYFAAHGVGPG